MEKKAFNRIGFGAMTGLLASQLLVLLVSMLISFGRVDVPAGPMNIIFYVLLYGSYFLILWLFVHKLPEYPRLDGRVSGGGAIGLVFAAAVVGMGLNDFLYLVGAYINDVLSQMMFGHSVDLSRLFTDETSNSGWEWIFVLCVMAPIGEELLFRGLVMKKLLPFGDKCAILVSGVMFGLFHGNFLQIFYAASGGLCLGYVYARTGKLRYPMMVHALINLFSLLETLLTAVELSDEAIYRIIGGVTAAQWVGAALLIAAFFRRGVLRPPACRFVRKPGPKLVFANPGLLTYLCVTLASCVLTIVLMGVLNIMISRFLE